MTINRLNLSAGIAFVWLLMSPSAMSTTLAQSINNACQNHPDAKTAQLRISQANERVNEAHSLIFPTINSITSAGISDDADGITGALNNARPLSTQLSLNQPLYLGGRARAAIKGAKFERQSEFFRSKSQLLNAQLTVVQAHISLAQAQEIIRVREGNLVKLKQQKSDAKRRYELGGGTKSDIVQADSRIARGESEIIAAQQSIDEAKADLYEASGVFVDEDLSFPERPIVPSRVQEAFTMAGRVNPDIKSANELIKQASQNIKSAKGDRAPEVRLLGDLNVQRDTVFNGFERDEASLQVQMTIPIFAGGALSSRQRSSVLAKTGVELDSWRIINRVRENVATSWSNLQAAQGQITVNEQLVKIAEQAAIAVKKEADAGFRPNLDVLDSQQELLEAQLVLTGARFDEVLSSYLLLGAIGELDNNAYEQCLHLLPDIEAREQKRRLEEPQRYIPSIPVKPAERRTRSGPRCRQ